MRSAFAILLLCAAVPFCVGETTPSTQTTDNSEKSKVYNDGSIRDINAIGNRNVGCGSGVGNWYSLEKQIAEGKQYADQVDQKSKMIKDSVVTEYVNRIGQNLVRN